MSKFIGRRLSVGIGKEISRGVGVAPTYWLNCLSFNHADKVNKTKVMGSFGKITGGDRALVTDKSAEGSMEVEVGDQSFGLLLLALMGTVSSASADGAYTHTYTLQDDNQHDSLSIHTDDPIGDLIFELSMIESMTINITQSELMKATVNFKSKNSAGSTSTASYIAENRFIGRHLTFKVASDTSGLTAASGISLKSLTININKNAEFDNVLGTIQPEDILNKFFTITGSLELNYEDRTWANYMLDNSYKAIRVDLVNTDVTIGTTNPSFRIDFSKCYFEAWEPNYDLDNIATQAITFEAMYDNGGNDNVINSMYLKNEVASY